MSPRISPEALKRAPHIRLESFHAVYSGKDEAKSPAFPGTAEAKAASGAAAVAAPSEVSPARGGLNSPMAPCGLFTHCRD